MKIIKLQYLILLISVIFFGTAHGQTKVYVGKFVVIDSERVFSETNLAKAMLANLKSEFSQRQNNLRNEALIIKNAAVELDKNASSMSNEARVNAQMDLKRRDDELILKQKSYTSDLNQRTYEERQKIAAVANGWLNKYEAKEKISLIIQNPAYVSLQSDITDTIIALINNQKTIDDVSYFGPKQSKVMVVNPEKIFNSAGLATGGSLSPKELEERNIYAAKVNLVLKSIAEKNQIDIIIQKAAYLKPEADITENIIALMGSDSGVTQKLAIDLNKYSSIAVINSEKVFKTFSNKNRLKLAEAGNIALAKIAQKNHIDIVVQEAAYLMPSFDITDEILATIIPPKENEPEQAPLQSAQSQTTPARAISIDEAKVKCKDLGFKVATDEFGKCVLQLTK